MEKFTKNGQVTDLNQIVIYHADGSYTCNITRETALSNGWTPYVDEQTTSAVEFAKKHLNESTTTDNATALSMANLYDEWNTYIGKPLNQGRIVRHEGSLWRVRQSIAIVQAEHSPSLKVASLYERVVLDHMGAANDPIPYEPPMEVFKGKIYTQNGVTYECTRDSGQALTHNLADLVGHYVKVYETSQVEPTPQNGTIDSPIEWLPTGDGTKFQDLEVGKYYIQGGVKYKCNRELKNTHYKLSDLVGNYVERIG